VFKIIARKFVQGLMMVLIVSAVTFGLLGLAGGDALTSLQDNPQVSAETIENMRRIYGLDQPMPVRYWRWLRGAVVGEMGESMYFRVPVSSLVWSRFLSTLWLGIAALVIALAVASALAVAAARYKSRLLSGFIEFFVFFTASTPRIVLALIALIFIAQLTATSGGTAAFAAFWLAAIALAAPLISIFLAQFHSGLTATMNEDFVQLARAKGLSEGTVVRRHALRAAAYLAARLSSSQCSGARVWDR
jgi:peptide/nickel transport system permease protein